MTARQLKIKSGAVKRLAKDVSFYCDEKSSHEEKVDLMIERGAGKHEINKQREFITESDSALQDVRMRFQTAYTDLEDVVLEMQDAGIGEEIGDVYTNAMEVMKQTAGLAPASRRLFEASDATEDATERTGNFTVAVYGSSTCLAEDELWALAREAGSAVAKAGCILLNGGYGGTMEASAMGASENGGQVSGVICPNAFPDRGQHGNKYLTKEVATSCIEDRIKTFTVNADCFVVLPGSLGTLTELIYTWNVQVVGQRKAASIIAFRQPWEKIIQILGADLELNKELTNIIRFVDNAHDLSAILVKLSADV